jgi:hypothetical protein
MSTRAFVRQIGCGLQRTFKRESNAASISKRDKCQSKSDRHPRHCEARKAEAIQGSWHRELGKIEHLAAARGFSCTQDVDGEGDIADRHALHQGKDAVICRHPAA